ncbi:MAG: hypothetical protein C9356_02790 [Oleiphilus sp.]|nr:MAG: hypothetical protein C9356_02790 [Oleiphilus sp.]
MKFRLIKPLSIHLASVLILSMLFGCAGVTSNSESHNLNAYGRYEGEILAEWGPDGRTMTLKSEITYIDQAKKRWPVPENTEVDGASIPRIFWSVIGGPFEGRYRNASVIHDYYCDTKLENWEDVHEMFYNAMRASGTDEAKAKMMYYAVYLGGPRWKRVHHTNHEPRAFSKPGDIDRIVIEEWKPTYDAEKAKETISKLDLSTMTLSEIKKVANSLLSEEEPPSMRWVTQ